MSSILFELWVSHACGGGGGVGLCKFKLGVFGGRRVESGLGVDDRKCRFVIRDGFGAPSHLQFINQEDDQT